MKVTLAEKVQVFYEIAMDVGTSLDLKTMLKTSLSTIMRKLNCSAGAILALRRERDIIRFEEVFSIPRNAGRNKTYAMAVARIPADVAASSKDEFIRQLPIVGKDERENNYFHIMELPGFGLMILVKSQEPLFDDIVKSLRPLNIKLANSCNACITQEKLHKSEERLRESNAKLNLTVRNLDEMNSLISHELQTGAQTIARLAGFILIDNSESLNSEGRECLDELKRRGKRLSRQLYALRDFAEVSIEAGAKETVDSNLLTKEIFAEMSPHEGIDMVIDGDLPVIEFEVDRISQVFRCLLGNAIRCFGDGKGIIRVACSDERGFWKFEVQDNGPGIPEAYHNKVFKVFQKIDDIKDDDHLGMGLAIAKKIVEKNGGNIWVKSEVGKGSTFYFTVPKSGHTANTAAAAVEASGGIQSN